MNKVGVCGVVCVDVGVGVGVQVCLYEVEGSPSVNSIKSIGFG